MKTNIEEIADAAVEINEVLKYAPVAYRLKITSKYRQFFNKAASMSKSKWKYDPTKKLYEQNLSPMAKSLLYDMHNKLIK
jgi:hypothetical protein